MNVGDVIRVSGWPGTAGQRFRVHRIRGDQTDAWRLHHGFGYSLRTFPTAACHVDRRATRTDGRR